jgi:hypothetical protein
VTDPFGRFEYRYWNGRKWTEHVSRGGQQFTDPPRPTATPTQSQVSSMSPTFQSPDAAHDGQTIRRPSRSQTPTLMLTMKSGARVPVANAVAIGRSPAAADGVQPLALDDAMLSKSHLCIGIDASGVWVVDTHSTNGVDVRSPDGAVVSITPGVRTPLTTGSRVRFGDSWCDVAVSAGSTSGTAQPS